MAEGLLGVERPLVNEVGEGPFGFDRPLAGPDTDEIVGVNIEDVPLSEKKKLRREEGIII